MNELRETCQAAGHWEHFPHAADMGVRGVGRTCAEAFAQAAEALCAITCDPDDVRPDTAVAIRCEAADRESLLVEWLNAVIYEMAVRRMIFRRFDVRIDGGILSAEAHGEPVDRVRHQPAVEAKGATYTELKVAQQADGTYLAQCIVDV